MLDPPPYCPAWGEDREMKEWTLWSDRVERIPLQTRPPVRTSIKTHVCVAFQRASPPSNLLIECYITHLDKKKCLTEQWQTDNWSADCAYVNFPVLKGLISSYFDCKLHFWSLIRQTNLKRVSNPPQFFWQANSNQEVKISLEINTSV